MNEEKIATTAGTVRTEGQPTVAPTLVIVGNATEISQVAMVHVHGARERGGKPITSTSRRG